MVKKHIPTEGIRLLEEVSEYLSIDPEKVLERAERRTPVKIARARKLLMLYLVHELKWTLQEAGKVCGIDNHTSVMYLINEALVEMERDSVIQILYHRSQKTYTTINVVKRKSSKKSITQLTLKGKKIKEWETVEIAANHFKISPSCLRDAALGKSKSSKGFKWKY